MRRTRLALSEAACGFDLRSAVDQAVDGVWGSWSSAIVHMVVRSGACRLPHGRDPCHTILTMVIRCIGLLVLCLLSGCSYVNTT
ncbi:MAG: hypothetical protein MK095_04220, partial [Phycisphaerales bacterium]|nr:hypothetical protein [Phycisphaerales bacterium]